MTAALSDCIQGYDEKIEKLGCEKYGHSLDTDVGPGFVDGDTPPVIQATLKACGDPATEFIPLTPIGEPGFKHNAGGPPCFVQGWTAMPRANL
jgi:hypothetical protein